MTYGLNRELFVEEGAAVQAARATHASSARAFAAWHDLDPAQRLALIDEALNDNHGDGYPIAL